MDAADTAPGDREPWTQFLTDTCSELQAAKVRIKTLETEVANLKKQIANTTAKVDEPYSLRAEEQRQQARGRRKKPKETRKQRRGRVANEEKIKLAEKTEDVYPQGVPVEQCRLSHVRVIWRLLEGRAVRVAYRVFRGPGKQYGRIPGVFGRSEYGLEIVLELAFLVLQVGLSLDKMCLTVNFLQNLKPSKSQAEALLQCEPAERPNGLKPKLDGTNNEAERKLRDESQARATGRTSKTTAGARRTTVVGSVLESLRLYLLEYTLASVIEEVCRWQEAGRSCFRALLDKSGILLPEHSVLDGVLPQPSG